MNKRKMLELYGKASTPQELFVDVIEKTDAIEQKVEKIKSDVDDQLLYFIENRPRTETELRRMIKEMTPEPIKGDPGKSYSEDELLAIILPLIPQVRDGVDAHVTPEMIRNKLKELKGKNRLSVFDLKDTEWLKGGKDRIQWNTAGFSVSHDSTLTGEGNSNSPLSVVGSFGPTNFHVETGVISSLTSLNLAHNATVVLNFIINGQGQHLTYDYTFTGNTVTYITPLDSSFMGLHYTIVFI